jgi:hypothetical protein
MNLTVCPVLKVLFVYLSVSLSANCSFVCRPKPDPRGPWAPTPPHPCHISMRVGVLRRNASWQG